MRETRVSAVQTLLLLRHAKSSWDDPSLEDFDRPLAKRGRKAAPRMAHHLKKKGLIPDLVLCSTAARAAETWGLVAEVLGEDIPVKYLKSLYLAPPSKMLASIRHLAEAYPRVMLIAHNPGMEHLAAALAGPGSNQKALQKLYEKYPTAALAEITFAASSWRQVERGSGRLVRLIWPKELT